jgi:hypothetical protein
MNLTNLMNFDENEIVEICDGDACFLKPLKKDRSVAESYLRFEGSISST